MANGEQKTGDSRDIAENSHNKQSEQSETSPKQIWEQQPGEPNDKYHAFQVFLDLGGRRTYNQASLSLGYSRGTIYNWSKQYQWLDRADAYDRSRYLEMKNIMNSHSSEQIKLNYEMNIDLSQLATEILPQIYHLLENSAYDYKVKQHHQRLKYVLLICKTIKQVQSLINFYPQVSPYSKLPLEENFLQFLFNEEDKANRTDESSQDAANRNNSYQTPDEEAAGCNISDEESFRNLELELAKHNDDICDTSQNDYYDEAESGIGRIELDEIERAGPYQTVTKRNNSYQKQYNDKRNAGEVISPCVAGRRNKYNYLE